MSTEDVDEFRRVFRRFLDQALADEPPRRPSQLHARITEHMGTDDTVTLASTIERWAPYRIADVYRGLTAVLGGGPEPIGFGAQFHHIENLPGLLLAARAGHVDLGSVVRRTVDISPDAKLSVVTSGLWLVNVDGAPAIVLMQDADHHRGEAAVRVQVAAVDPAVAQDLVSRIATEADRHSVLRGQVLSFASSEFGPGAGPVRFLRRPVLTRADLVLPEGTLDIVERQVLGIAAERETLRRRGQHLKRGVLLHGPPGTGKTLTVRYLIGQLEDVTVILLAGPALAQISHACDLARAFQPALVVLEDCDLVAESRDYSFGPQPLLFQVLDELDGLAEDADVTFLLTTNRAAALESALSERPGRVDQAVEIPLPDDAGRRTLFHLYARGVPLADDVDIDDVIARTSGTTASYLKELVRRCVLIAAFDDSDVVLARHVSSALDELSVGREELTQALIGGRCRPAHFVAGPPAQPGVYMSGVQVSYDDAGTGDWTEGSAHDAPSSQ